MWRRMLLVTLALVLGLAGALPASAQFSETGVPDDAVDGAAVTWQQDSGDDRTAPTFSFLVFAFVDDAAAAKAQDDLPGHLAHVTGPGLDIAFGDPSDLDEVDSAVLAGLDGVGEDARAYQEQFDGGLGNSSIDLLTIRDGANLHVWVSFLLDVGGLLVDAGVDVGIPVVTPAANGGQGLADLVGIAGAWSRSDRPDGGDLIDQLPTADQLPDGYGESGRYENLDDFRTGAMDAPSARPERRRRR